jgi:hypothetical protein
MPTVSSNHVVRFLGVALLCATAFLAANSTSAQGRRGRDTLHDVLDCAPFQRAWKGATARGWLTTGVVDSAWYSSWMQSLADANPDTALLWARRAFWVQSWMSCMLVVAHKRMGYRTIRYDTTILVKDTFLIAGGQMCLRDLSARVVQEFGTCASIALFGMGSTYGPPLAPYAPVAWTVEKLMREQMRKIVRSERHVLWDPATDVLQVATWMEPWAAAMQEEAGDVVAFLMPYMDDPMAAAVALRRKTVVVVYSDRLERWKRRRQ